jgi:toxin ParE1/3/4
VTTYLLSRQADADLVSIYEYTLETWGIEQFTIYSAQINRALRTIAAPPEAPGTYPREDLAKACRFYRVGHHIIAYRIGNQQIEVARILHEKMNFELHLIENSFPR